ncbi:MAG TPA: fibronectin type III domain-containing protein, partial [Gemmatimonadales bacterium]|nr:fibronectin type III domain-containing protein [Gemmatimonadales bacterium]
AVSGVESTLTTPVKPRIFAPQVSNVTAASATVTASLLPDNFETEYRLEYTTEPKNPASWVAVPGSEGTILAADATEEPRNVTANLIGLSPSATYYVRLFAKNEHGEGVWCQPDIFKVGLRTCEPASATTLANGSFQTFGPPAPTTFAVHVLHGEDVMRALGSVSPNGAPTLEEQALTVGGGATGGTFTITFEGETTAPIPFVHQAGEGVVRVKPALEALPSIGNGGVSVLENFATNTYTIIFHSTRDLPQITVDASGLTPSGTATVATIQHGVLFDFGYHFEYTTSDFSGCGTPANPNCLTTPAVDLGGGNGSAVGVAADLPEARPGGTYRYRLVAHSNSSGNPVVDGAEQVLTVPVPASPGPEEECPNRARRTGPSANLPDCRAYEQVTPSEKGAATDILQYGHRGTFVTIGEDGEHLLMQVPGVQWGPSPDPVASTYVFARGEGGWGTTSARPPSEVEGVSYLDVALFNGDLTQLGFDHVGWSTGAGPESANLEVRVGPPGGPYTTIATIPRAQALQGSREDIGLVAASADASKYVIQTEDRNLLGHPTGTTSGFDLYEYSEGQLRLVNVDSEGKEISACGARIVKGREQAGGGSSRYAVSADGRRVFFTDNCTGHLYMRVGGGETVDIGAYGFVEAKPDGSQVLISHTGLFRYDAATRAIEPVAAGESFSPQRYSYSDSGGILAELSGLFSNNTIFGAPKMDPRQVVRYDSAEHLIQCISCASPFDPEPKQLAALESQIQEGKDGAAHSIFASANGDYVVFQTPSALLPSDVDGESEPSENASKIVSSSSDVYEWRRDGLGGCSHVQGCLALISGGHGGYYVELLGIANEGRDIFFTTNESLVPQDTDTAIDIYDARIGGGFPPPPPRPVECEGDACSTPFAAPNDLTPSSSTFQGAGNLIGATLPASKSKPKLKKAKKKTKKKGKAKAKRKVGRARKAGKRRAG